MSVYLAIETALSGCHVALYAPARGVSDERHEKMQRGQSERLVPLLQEILRDHQCSFQDITHVVAVVGPGSFTGLRVGLSTARTLVQAVPCTGLGVTSFAAFACTHPSATAIILESQRVDFYVHVDGQDELLSSHKILERFAAQPMRFAGDGVARLKSECVHWPKHWQVLPGETPDLQALLRNIDAGQGTAIQPLSPYYLRAPDVTAPQKAV